MWGFGHRDLVHKIMQALRAFWIFLAESPPVSSSRALLLFRASGFGTSTMGQRRFATGGSTFTATSVLPPRSSSGGRHNGNTGTDGGGGEVSILFRLEKQIKKGLL